MKLIIGFLGGLVVGAAGAIAYSMQTGKDLREIVEDVRSDLSTRDLDALGARLETRVSEMQKELEGRIAAVKEKASAAVDAAGDKAAEALDAAADTAGTAAADASDAAGDAAETATETATEAVAEVKDAVEDQSQG